MVAKAEPPAPPEYSELYPDQTLITVQEPKPETDKPKIPDGGWGWMIVVSSLVISLIQDGISFSLGLLQPEFVEDFEASQSACAWVVSLFLALPLLSGPFMSALVDKYGCRAMTIVGGLVSASGFILSFFVHSIGLMYLTFGIVSGLGLGLTYITAVVSIAFWFDKKRNLAVGLGACGTGIGTIVYAPFTNKLLEVFDWRGTVVILAGTLLNMCVCGALMRDPDWLKEQNRQNSKLSSKSSSLSNVSIPSQKINLEDIRNLLKSGKDAEYVLQTLATSIEHEDKGQKSEHHQSVLNLPTFIKQNEKVPVEVLEQLSENKKLYKVIVHNYPSLLQCRSTSEKGLNKLAEDASFITRIPVTFSLKLKKTAKPKAVTHQYSLPENPSAVTEPLISPDRKSKVTKSPPHVDKTDTTAWLVKQFSSTTQHQNYFKNMRFPRHSLTHRGVVLNKNKYRLRASSCPNIYRVSMTTLTKDEDERWYSRLINAISLFFEFHFFLMSISTIILFAWFMTPYIFIVDHLMESGYSSDEASIVLSVIGAANTIGMIALGWAGDQPWANVQKTYGVCLILCGVCCSAMYIFTWNYILLNICGVLYGVFLASNFSFTPVLLVELLPLDTFTKAYGLQLMCQGLGHLGGPPLAGLLKDITHSWSYSFHLAGVHIVAAGMLVLLIPYTRNRKLIGSGPLEKDLANEGA
ncbi:monocarboxylate transporter 14-like [Asbolus verrucosus]|uniref:Monocarboxylate transporter 14-like n=1 Tax=Asbolus verrucosus TaxID=1661398 RepID=A0A482VUA2_ASBVE|nr:monocarboxylate transporter 14-like [Asbolus verrucosus]